MEKKTEELMLQAVEEQRQDTRTVRVAFDKGLVALMFTGTEEPFVMSADVAERVAKDMRKAVKRSRKP